MRKPYRLACLALLVLSGCAGLDDPFQRAGTWNPEGSNDANLRTTVANPMHLVRGASDPTSPAALSVGAVNRLLADQVKPLTDHGSGQIAQSAGPQFPGPGGGGK